MFTELFQITQEINNLLVNEFGFTFLKSKGLEADDLILLVTEQHPQESVIITGDKDILQLAKPTRKIFYKPKGEYIDNHGIIPFDKVIFGDKIDEIGPVVDLATRYRKKITTLLEPYSKLTTDELNQLIKKNPQPLIKGVKKYVKETEEKDILNGLRHNAKMILLTIENLPKDLLDNLGNIKLNKVSKKFIPSKDTIAYIQNKIMKT